MKFPLIIFNAVLSAALLTSYGSGAAEAAKSFPEAAKLVSQKLSANDIPGAKEAAVIALELAKTPTEKTAQKLLCAQIAQRAGEKQEAIKLFGEIFDDQSAMPGQRVQAQKSIAEILISQKKYGEARKEYDKALAFDGLKANERFDLIAQKAESFEKEKSWAAARAEYAKISTDKELDKLWQLRSAMASAKTFASEKNYAQAVESYNKLLALSGLDTKGRKSVHEAIVTVYTSQKDWAASRAECAKILALPDLNDNDKFGVAARMVEIARLEGELKTMQEAVVALIKMPGADNVKAARLTALAELAIRYNQWDSAIAAYNDALALADNDIKNRGKAYSSLLELLGQKGDIAAAKKILSAAVSDKALSPAKRCEAHLALIALNASETKKAFPKDEIIAALKEYEASGLGGADKLKALQDASKFFVRIFDYKTAREFLGMADALLVKQPRKTYACRYMENVPLGAGGWFLSDMLKDEKLREARFADYDKESAAMLFADATADRVVAEDKGKAFYFENTAFYMVYDKAGWHMFVLSGENNAQQILADGVGAGALEMYFSPGIEGQTYFQWIIDLPKGEASVYDWNSPHRFFRPLTDSLKTETVAKDKAWGTYIFIPWEVLYDKLPFEAEGGKWPFGFIRWSPSGGLTWGGRVHEIGRWGLIEWEKPARKDEAVIKKNILRKAWGKYKKDRAAQQVFWSDKVIGDPAFYEKALLPEIERLNKLGEPMQAPDKLSDEDAVRLYKEVVSDWMEFDYLTSELRKSYLENEL